MANLDYSLSRSQVVQSTGDNLRIGSRLFHEGHIISLGPPFGDLSVKDISLAFRRYFAISQGKCRPQLPALIYEVTGHPEALSHYFPLRRVLGKEEKCQFDALVAKIRQDPNFDLQIIREDGPAGVSEIPTMIPALVAGHIGEVFFHRQDILRRFLHSPRHFLIFASERAFGAAGGVAGGCYHPGRESLMIGLPRLFEGFNGDMPGVSPFLHEFGHMLDYFDARTGRMSPVSNGYLPGMLPEDGALYTPNAFHLFRLGKAIEIERYKRCQRGKFPSSGRIPFAHPYLFTSNSEFVAGILELFLRCPNQFSQNNHILYRSLCALFNWDPRDAWPEDFDFYPRENRKAYLNGVPLPASRLTELPRWVARILRLVVRR